MRFPLLIDFFLLLALAAAIHRLPLFKQKSSAGSKKVPSGCHNSEFTSLLTSARDDPAKFDGSGFAVQLQIGTPAQLFNAQVAFESAEMWIADSSCQYWTYCKAGCGRSCTKLGCAGCCDPPAQCPMDVLYNSSSSSTYHTEGRLWKMNDGLSGILGYDAIALDADLSLPVGEFVQVTTLGEWATPCYGACENISGVLGLALAGVSSTNTPSVVEQAYNQELLEKPLVGLWMSASKTAAVGDVVGELTFGNWDHEKCGEVVVFVPLAGPDAQWTFWIDGAQIGTYELGNAWRAVLDLDFDSWSVPEQLFEMILASTNAQWDSSISEYVVDCTLDTPLTLTTAGGDLVIPSAAFTVRVDADRCVLDIRSNFYTQNDEMTFRSSFLTQFCAVFAYEKQQFGYAAIN